MDPKPKPGTIFDTTGKPIVKPGESIEDLNLPAGVQALIETRINSAIDNLRQDNSSSLKNLAHDYAGKWRTLAIGGAIFGLLGFGWGVTSWWKALNITKEWSKNYIATQIDEPVIKKTIADITKSQAADIVSNQIEPIRASAGVLGAQITALGNTSSALEQKFSSLSSQQTTLEAKLDEQDKSIKQQEEKQIALTTQQESTDSRVRYQQWDSAAKTGDLKAYANLSLAAESGSETGKAAQVYLQDVDQYYYTDRYELAEQKLIDPISNEQVTCSIDDIIDAFKSGNFGEREAAANTLNELGKKSSVTILCNQLGNENDLRVIARITRALEDITKEKFSPLDKSAALEWWSKNKGIKDYYFALDDFDKGRGFVEAPSADINRDFAFVLDPNKAADAIVSLHKVLDAEPTAYESQVWLGLALATLKKFPEAEAQFSSIEKSEPNYEYLDAGRAALLMMEGKTGQAIDEINSSLENTPSTMFFIKKFALFKTIADDKRIKWPDLSKLLNKS